MSKASRTSAPTLNEINELLVLIQEANERFHKFFGRCGYSDLKYTTYLQFFVRQAVIFFVKYQNQRRKKPPKILPLPTDSSNFADAHPIHSNSSSGAHPVVDSNISHVSDIHTEEWTRQAALTSARCMSFQLSNAVRFFVGPDQAQALNHLRNVLSDRVAVFFAGYSSHYRGYEAINSNIGIFSAILDVDLAETVRQFFNQRCLSLASSVHPAPMPPPHFQPHFPRSITNSGCGSMHTHHIDDIHIDTNYGIGEESDSIMDCLFDSDFVGGFLFDDGFPSGPSGGSGGSVYEDLELFDLTDGDDASNAGWVHNGAVGRDLSSVAEV